MTRGDARLDNRKAKAVFGGKVRMLDLAAVEAATGHPVGGVCPFGLIAPLPVYCDVSLKAFDEVVPAAGSTHSAVRIAPDRMADLTGATLGRCLPGSRGEPAAQRPLQSGVRLPRNASMPSRKSSLM